MSFSKNDLEKITEINRPYTRLVFSNEFLKGREWLSRQFKKLKLQTSTDEAGNLEIATQSIRILNRVELQSMPYVIDGVAISTYSMELDFDPPQLPPAGVFYPSAYNKGMEPLVLFNLTMESPYGVDINVDSVEAWIDLDQFLPSAINQSTVELLRLSNWSSTVTNELDGAESFTVYNNGSLHMTLSLIHI